MRTSQEEVTCQWHLQLIWLFLIPLPKYHKNISWVISNSPDIQHSSSYNMTIILHLFQSPIKGPPTKLGDCEDAELSFYGSMHWLLSVPCHISAEKQSHIPLMRPMSQKHSADGVSLGLWPSIDFPLLTASGVWVSHPDASVGNHALRCLCLGISLGLVLFSIRWRTKLY